MPRWLFALLVAALVFYTDDYIIAGILPELADDLGVSEAQAGQLVTVFSLTVAVSAPVAAVASGAAPCSPSPWASSRVRTSQQQRPRTTGY